MHFDTSSPIYIQIAEYLASLILRGHYGDGTRIPSARELAVELEVNPNTVVRSYALLQEQGVLEVQRGVGYFTTKDATATIKRLRRASFTEKELPAIVKTMKSLDITVDELVASIGDLYETY